MNEYININSLSHYVYISAHIILVADRGSSDSGAVLQIGRSLVGYLQESVEFFIVT